MTIMKDLFKVVSLSTEFLLLKAGMMKDKGGKVFEGSTPVADDVEKGKWPELAQIPLEDAVLIALEDTAGKTLEAELEVENGYLIWEIELAKEDGEIIQVKVDAGDGRIVARKSKGHKTAA